MTSNFADRLLAAIEDKGSPVCVGLDPVYERLPEAIAEPQADAQRRVAQVGQFCRELLEIVAPIVPAVKPQIAYFELLGHRGVELYYEMVALAKQLGLIVIGDIKRGDIGSTAQAYATAHLRGDMCPDAVTVNGYFGTDGLAPFVDACRDEGKGAFVLVRTSNPSAAAVQDFANADGVPFYEHIASQMAQLGSAQELVGDRGYSCVGAVVGATYPDEARRLRQIMPQQLFLVPGYGAQGATAADCAASFKPDGTGAIVNASRSVIYAFAADGAPSGDWRIPVSDAAKAFAEDIASALR